MVHELEARRAVGPERDVRAAKVRYFRVTVPLDGLNGRLGQIQLGGQWSRGAAHLRVHVQGAANLHDFAGYILLKRKVVKVFPVTVRALKVEAERARARRVGVAQAVRVHAVGHGGDSGGNVGHEARARAVKPRGRRVANRKVAAGGLVKPEARHTADRVDLHDRDFLRSPAAGQCQHVADRVTRAGEHDLHV